nr:RNA-directed DNA polymerase, eukaryota, reverse transcriptase zinc-binding domain protein [Tanacetum cinerariifolium]
MLCLLMNTVNDPRRSVRKVCTKLAILQMNNDERTAEKLRRKSNTALKEEVDQEQLIGKSEMRKGREGKREKQMDFQRIDGTRVTGDPVSMINNGWAAARLNSTLVDDLRISFINQGNKFPKKEALLYSIFVVGLVSLRSSSCDHISVDLSLSNKIALWSSLLQLTVTWDGILVMMGDFYKNLVVDTWTNDGIVHANGLVSFKKKLHNIKLVIREWVGLKSEEDFINRRDALKSLGDFARMEARDLSQNAKTKWALEGDENTEFFHGTIKKRRRQLAIKGIMKNGVWIEEPGIVKAEFISHFSHRFQQPTGILTCFDTDQFRPLSPSQRDFLERPFPPDEINRVILDCGAFIKDRNILDGPIILNEVVAWYCQRKKKRMVFKIDFEKAFDYVHWDFLDLIMDKLGLDLKWRNWINGCLHNAHSSMLVNGSPTEEFEVFRCLRQGYPMSPFLFILAMEGLHALTSKAKAMGLFKGASIGRDNMSISHLMYANDVIFLENGVGVTDEEVSYMANIIGCGASKFPMKYLGVPVGCNMARNLSRCAISSSYGVIQMRKNDVDQMGLISVYCSSESGGSNVALGALFFPRLTISNQKDDIWCGQQPLKEVFPRIYSLDTDKGCFIANRVGLYNWNLVLRRTPRGGAESAQFNSLKETIGNIILTDQHDSWRWSLDVSKGFSVASVRQLVDSHILVMGNEATRWNRSLPIKVNVFLWRLKLNKLPSRVNLDRIGIEISSLLCPLCLGDFETINHSFFNCDMAKGLWSLFAKWWEVDILVCGNIAEWYEWLGGFHVYSKVRLFLEEIGGLLCGLFGIFGIF